MAVIIIDEILDPIGNSKNNEPLPTLYCKNTKIKREYGVKVKWAIDKDTETLQYQTAIYFKGYINEKSVHEISKEQFFVNGESVKNPMYGLASACADICNPITIMVTTAKKIVDIENHDALAKRFADSKPQLLRDFGGQIAEDYIAQTEATINNKNLLTKNLQQDLWLSLFFADIYTPYNKETSDKKMRVALPVFGFHERLIFDGTAQVDFKKNEVGICALRFEGQLDMEEIPADVRDAYNPLGGHIHATYYLHGYEKYIIGIECNIGIDTPQGQYNANLNGYQLGKGNRVVPPPPPPAPPPKKPPRKKWTGGWSILWND